MVEESLTTGKELEDWNEETWWSGYKGGLNPNPLSYFSSVLGMNCYKEQTMTIYTIIK